MFAPLSTIAPSGGSVGSLGGVVLTCLPFCQRTVLEPSSTIARFVYAAETNAPNMPSAQVLLMRPV